MPFKAHLHEERRHLTPWAGPVQGTISRQHWREFLLC